MATSFGDLTVVALASQVKEAVSQSADEIGLARRPLVLSGVPRLQRKSRCHNDLDGCWRQLSTYEPIQC